MQFNHGEDKQDVEYPPTGRSQSSVGDKHEIDSEGQKEGFLRFDAYKQGGTGRGGDVIGVHLPSAWRLVQVHTCVGGGQ